MDNLLTKKATESIVETKTIIGHIENSNDTFAGKNESKKIYLAFKRIFDICLSTVSIIILFIPSLILSFLIFCDDPHGSPIFVQTRIGKNGKKFKFYKFRSMVVGAEEMLDDLLEYNEADGNAFKMKDDPRITRIGRFIRKTSIDELPQLINILKGDMSFVGPRPPIPREVDNYTDYQKQRLSVTPGLTCYWQTTPNRNDMPFDEWVALDLKYIENRSALVDLKLIFKTFSVMFTGQGR